jgi:hypothetical protein
MCPVCYPRADEGANPEMSDPNEQHYHWDRGHTYVVEGAKQLILINGGAAIGVMTFAGNSHFSVSWLLVVSIGFFALGALSGTIVFLFAFLAELKYGNGEWEAGQREHRKAYSPALGAAALFAVGMMMAAVALYKASPSIEASRGPPSGGHVMPNEQH